VRSAACRTVSLVQLITTVDGRDAAVQLARAAVEARAAACVQIVGPIDSVYRWDGKVEEAEEFLLVMKVPAEGLERLAGFVLERHPYDTPELTTMPSGWVEDRYLAWARAETTGGTGVQRPRGSA
jgi:periplasmic divalent cation tolerance protein